MLTRVDSCLLSDARRRPQLAGRRERQPTPSTHPRETDEWTRIKMTGILQLVRSDHLHRFRPGPLSLDTQHALGEYPPGSSAALSHHMHITAPHGSPRRSPATTLTSAAPHLCLRSDRLHNRPCRRPRRRPRRRPPHRLSHQPPLSKSALTRFTHRRHPRRWPLQSAPPPGSPPSQLA